MARLSDSGEIKPVVKKAWREPTENEDDVEKSIHSLKVRLELCRSNSFCAAPERFGSTFLTQEMKKHCFCLKETSDIEYTFFSLSY